MLDCIDISPSVYLSLSERLELWVVDCVYLSPLERLEFLVVGWSLLYS